MLINCTFCYLTGIKHKVIKRLPYLFVFIILFLGKLEHVTVSYGFSFIKPLANISFLWTCSLENISRLGLCIQNLPLLTDLSQVQEKTGVLASFRKIGEKDSDTDEQHCRILTHFPQRL